MPASAANGAVNVVQLRTEIENEMSSLGSYRAYRERLRKQGHAPVIPFLCVPLAAREPSTTVPGLTGKGRARLPAPSAAWVRCGAVG